MTTTTTTVMGTIDIPCTGDKVKMAASSEENLKMATPTLTRSSFILGSRQDRVLTIKAGNVKITSTSMPDKHVTLSTKCWAHFMSICKKVDNEAQEVSRQMRPVAYRAHIGELYYVSVTSGMDLLTFVIFTFHMALRARTCVLLAVELVFALMSGYIY